ncbi:MAG: phospholipase D-like domain-containing protein, partial [bacterium]
MSTAASTRTGFTPLGARVCLRDRIKSLFRKKVQYPAYVTLSIEQAFLFAKLPGALSARLGTQLAGRRRFGRDFNVSLPKDILLAEVAANDGKLYVGKKLFHGLLVVSEIHGDRLVIVPNPAFHAEPKNELFTTAANLRETGTDLTKGLSHESVKDLVEGDFESVLAVLAQDNVEEVRQAMEDGTFGQILQRLDEATLRQVINLTVSAVARLEKILARGEARDLYHFLPVPLQRKIDEKIFPQGWATLTGDKHFCEHVEPGLERLPAEEREAILKGIARTREGIRERLDDVRNIINVKPDDREAVLRESLVWAADVQLFIYLDKGHQREIATAISEARRRIIVADVEQSNLVENVKVPLMHILSEREVVYVSMFSFTHPLFSAALTAASLRGAEVKILLDRKEATHKNSQFETLNEQDSLEVRTFATASQHQKLILCVGQGVMCVGSQNISTNAFRYNYENLLVIQGDQARVEQARSEFVEVFSRQGEVIPLPADIIAQRFIARSGLIGLRSKGGVPTPAAIETAMTALRRLRPGDTWRVRDVVERITGLGFDLEIDLTGPFRPFIGAISDPLTAYWLLPDFLKRVLPGFSWAAASSTGKFHPGSTAELSGLIEHEFIVCELGIMICKFLGRADLIDQVVFSSIIHDSFKNARRGDDGQIYWGSYNPAHGYLADEVAGEVAEAYDLDPTAAAFVRHVRKAAGQHMTHWNKPEPTPLRPSDNLINWIVAMADMLAASPFLYVDHRCVQPMDRATLAMALVHNSQVIQGDGLTPLLADKEMAGLIQTATAAISQPIAGYGDVPQRAKKMLLIAERVCTLMQNEENNLADKDDSRRLEILTAALLYGTLRYQLAFKQTSDPRARQAFNKVMAGLYGSVPKDQTRQRAVLDLMVAADKRLAKWGRAELTPTDDPALWVLGVADCLMVSDKTWTMTDDQVKEIFSQAEVPRTTWTRVEQDEAKCSEVATGVADIVMAEHLDRITPIIEEGLRAKLNFRRRAPYKFEDGETVHLDIVKALVRKFGAIDSQYIYDHYYAAQGNSKQRTDLMKKIKAASAPEAEAERSALVAEIDSLPLAAQATPSKMWNLLAQAALLNGMDSAEKVKDQVVAPSLDRESLRNYDYFAQMPTAVDKITEKLSAGEQVCVYGDYDMDGQAGTAILVDVLRRIRAEEIMADDPKVGKRDAFRQAKNQVRYYIPHRLKEGYGLNENALETIHRRGASLVITNDCGISNKKAIEAGHRLGLEFVVTDHHESPKDPADLPQDVVAIINPKAEPGLPADHPVRPIPGAGMAYKLALACAEKVGMDFGDEYLDIVAMACVADVVPLLGENRAFVRYGLEKWNSDNKNIGLSDLMKVQNLGRVDEETLAFFVAPLFNVLGRLGSASEGVRLLLSRRPAKREVTLSFMLDAIDERRQIEQSIIGQAREMLKDKTFFDPEQDGGIAVTGEGWHKGVIGIVSSSLVREFGVPVVTIASNKTEPGHPEIPAYGSMRTIQG